MARRVPPSSDEEVTPTVRRKQRRPSVQTKTIRRKQVVKTKNSKRKRNVAKPKSSARKTKAKEKDFCCLVAFFLPGGFLFVILSWAWEAFNFKTFVRLVLSFSVGGGCVGLYLWGKFDIPHYYSISGGFFAGLILFILMHYSQKARCTAMLCLPEIGSFTGRFVVGLFVTWLVVQYPLENMISNGREISRGSQCAGKILTAQAEMLKMEILQFQAGIAKNLVDHFDSIIRPMNVTISTIDNHLDRVQTSIAPIHDTIEWLRKECGSEVSSAFSSCTNATSKMYEGCKGTLGFLCEPMNWAGETCKGFNKIRICNVLKPVEEIGTAVPALREQVQKAYGSLRFEIEHSKDTSLDSDVSSKLKKMQVGIDEELGEHINMARLFLQVIHYIMFLLPLLVLPIRSYWYLRKCLLRIERGHCDLEANEEEEEVSEERGKFLVFVKVFFVLFKLFSTLCLFFAEYCLYALTVIIRKHGTVEFVFDGSMDFKASLKNSGLGSGLVKILSPDVNVSRHFNFTVNPKECLPTTTPLSPYSVYVLIAALYAVLLVITWLAKGILGYRKDIVKFCFRAKILENKEARRYRRRR